jgi:hypothetical protein
VVYAAVATNQPAAELSADADLIAYAAGTGQTPGVTPGDLPPGYLPLPASLQSQATTVVNQLRADAQASTSSSSPATGATSASGSGAGTTSLTPAGAGGSVSGATSGAGLSITPPRAQLAAARTGREPVGGVRWLLLAVVIAGAACAASGTVLRSASVVRWLSRMRA